MVLNKKTAGVWSRAAARYERKCSDSLLAPHAFLHMQHLFQGIGDYRVYVGKNIVSGKEHTRIELQVVGTSRTDRDFPNFRSVVFERFFNPSRHVGQTERIEKLFDAALFSEMKRRVRRTFKVNQAHVVTNEDGVTTQGTETGLFFQT